MAYNFHCDNKDHVFSGFQYEGIVAMRDILQSCVEELTLIIENEERQDIIERDKYEEQIKKLKELISSDRLKEIERL